MRCQRKRAAGQISARNYFIRYVILLLVLNMSANMAAFVWTQRMMRRQVFSECGRICADMRAEVERKRRILTKEVRHLISSVYNLDFFADPDHTKQKEIQLSVDMLNDMGLDQIHILMVSSDSERIFNFSRTQNPETMNRILEEASEMRADIASVQASEYGIVDDGDIIWVIMLQLVPRHNYEKLVWEEVGSIIGCIGIEKADFYSVYEASSSIKIEVEKTSESNREDTLSWRQRMATVYRTITMDDRKWTVRCDLTFAGFQGTYTRFYEIVFLLFLFNVVVTASWIRGFHRFFVNPVKEILSSIRSAQFHYRTHISEEYRCRETVDIAKYFNDLIDRFRHSARESFQNQQKYYEMEICEKDRAMKALQSQINPHFIYNMLENIKVLASLGKNEDIERVVIHMSQFLRYSLYVDGFSTMEDELRATCAYLEIMDICYDNGFCSEVDVPKELLGAKVPKMVLQPLVENYFKHGLILDGRDNRIRIQACREGEVLLLSVCDNGIGITKDQLNKINEELRQSVFCQSDHGFGLYSIHKRIRTIYGETFGVTLESRENDDTRVYLRIPLVLSQEDVPYHMEEKIGDVFSDFSG